MCTATEFDREAVAEIQDAYLVFVLLAEQGNGARGHGIVVLHMLDVGRRILANLFVDEVLDLLQLLHRYRLVMRKVEPQPVGCDQRTFLLHVFAEDLAQCCVHQVRSRMVEHDGRAALAVDPGGDLVAFGQFAALHLADMHNRFVRFLRIRNQE